MQLEPIRIVADWLNGVTTGSSDYSINAQLPSVERDGGDAQPPAVHVYDETRDGWVARRDVPNDAAIALPAIVVCYGQPMTIDGEIHQNGTAAIRGGKAQIIVGYLLDKSDTALSVRNALYTKRAILRSLTQLHDETNAPTARLRNNVSLRICDDMTLTPPLARWGDSRDAWLATAAVLDYTVRDLAPLAIVGSGGSDEITYLRNNIVGGDAAMLAFYSVQYGVTQASGVVSKWADARGAGYGPDLTASGMQQPAWDATNLLITFDGVTNCLASALSALFDLSTAKAVVFVGSVPTDGRYVGGIARGAGSPPWLLLLGHTGAVASAYYGAGALVFNNSVVGVSSTRRVAVASKDAAITGNVDVPNQARVTGNADAAGAGNNTLTIGDLYPGAGSGSATVFRSALVLNHVPSTPSELAAIATWATTYHTAVLA